MAHCPFDKIKGLEPAFIKIRMLDKIKEPKPGIFYYKSKGFLHFHIKDDKIWADVRNGKTWGPSINIPNKITKLFLKEFVEIVTEYHNTN